jgi:phosphatidylserine/phosphatidylglycerophosphate/cardiolipin synthase-like enzyme
MTGERYTVSCILLLVLFLAPWKSYGTDRTMNTPATTCFSPGTDCTEATVKEIKKAKSEILVLAYVLTSSPIVKALSEAHKRGVTVQVILGRSHRRDASAAIFVNMKVPAYVDDKHTIADSEVIIVDQNRVITGPFGSRKASDEKSAESVLFIKSKSLAKTYLENWSLHRKHSKPYQANQTTALTGKR